MRKIAILLAIPFALLTAVANTHMAAAHAAQYAKQKPENTSNITAKTVKQQPAAPTSPVVVTVRSGDTLSGIASAHGTTYMRLFDANTFISDPDMIYPGQNITIPASDAHVQDRALPASAPAPQTVKPAPIPAPATKPALAPAPALLAPQASISSDVAAAKAYIYMRESGNNTDAANSNGCYGLGQDCSGQVHALCGDNYVCQDDWFTNYASSRYGGWVNAEAFWQNHRWW